MNIMNNLIEGIFKDCIFDDPIKKKVKIVDKNIKKLKIPMEQVDEIIICIETTIENRKKKKEIVGYQANIDLLKAYKKLEDRRAYQRKAYKENPERVKQNAKKWQKENPERVKQNAKNYYKKNPEKHLERVRKWQKENPERVKEIIKKWQKENPERMKENAKNYYKNKKAEKEVKINGKGKQWLIYDGRCDRGERS